MLKKKKRTKLLNKKARETVIRTFQLLVKAENVLLNAIAAVNAEQHIIYYSSRKQAWDHMKSKADGLLTIIRDAIAKYVELFSSHSTGAEKYGRLLSSWYTYAGTWAVADLSNDDQKLHSKNKWIKITMSCRSK